MASILETDRLSIREFNERDLEIIYTLHSDPEVMRFSSRRSPESRTEATETLRRIIEMYRLNPGFGIWAAELKSSGDFVGWFGIGNLAGTAEIEIGYRLLKNHWGNGFATEGARKLLEYAFVVLNLNHLVAISDLDNIASKKVLEKAGFKYVGKVEYQASPNDPKEIVNWFVAMK